MVPTEDGRYVFFLRSPGDDPRNTLWEVDVATGTLREVLRPDALLQGPEVVSAEEKARRERARVRSGGFTSFEATRDGSAVVVGLSGRLFVWTRATGKARELPVSPGTIDPHLSPDGTKLAYVRNNDVYVVPLAGGKETAVTRGGTETNPHGVAEFMAQEEFERSRGFWWSPDGNSILYEDADLSAVPKWTLADPAHPEAPAQIIAYPKVGAPHATVRLAIADARAGAAKPPRKITWDGARYPYLTKVVWSKNAPPTIYVRDRAEQHGALLAIDPATGGTKVLLTEEDSAWLEIDPSVPRWLPDGSGFLWATERSGGWELELHDAHGAKTSTVVPRSMGYRHVNAVDPVKKVAYVAASNEPNRGEVWAAPFDGSAPRPVFRNTEATVWASFGDSTQLYAFSEATVRAEHRFGVRSVDGAVNIAIPSVAKAPPFAPNIEYASVGKDDVRVALVRPRNFDAKRRYPVIDNIYGGPINNMVVSDAKRYLDQQWLADTVQAVVVMIDSRGTMYRGRAWQRAFRDRFGDLPIVGHAEALSDLGQKFPELDVSRVGIYGWSGGGYYSAMAILRRPDVFKAAVAGALVADMADYDALLERFLGTPPNKAYDDASLLLWAAKPPTPAAPARPILWIHGTADDNVYLLHGLKFAEAMARGGRPMEFMPLGGQTHMVSAPESIAAVRKRTAEYFREHLHASKN
ncbi:DPP IV N-terminal domain-containing protein [Pendulispora albinea]|uniref:S9 family peptidase n=1 Tax=Pendulispora albinea TaxID=2741071 RepID=A0ABZ2LT39_9BACT